MKKIIFILCLIFSFTIISCSKNENLISPTESEYVTLSVGITDGDFNFEDVTKAGTYNRDALYGIQIYLIPDSFPMESFMGAGMYYDEYWYAYGLFDDISLANFRLLKDKRYIVEVKYLPNAKKIVYKYSKDSYGHPFSTGCWGDAPLNKINYTSYDGFIALQSSVQTEDSRQSVGWHDFEAYYGFEEIRINENSTFDVKLYSQTCKISLTVNIIETSPDVIVTRLGNLYETLYLDKSQKSVTITYEHFEIGGHYALDASFNHSSLYPVPIKIGTPDNDAYLLNKDIYMERNHSYHASITAISPDETDSTITVSYGDTENNTEEEITFY